MALPAAGFAGVLASGLGALSAFFGYYLPVGFFASFGASFPGADGAFLASLAPSFGALLVSFLASPVGLAP